MILFLQILLLPDGNSRPHVNRQRGGALASRLEEKVSMVESTAREDAIGARAMRMVATMENCILRSTVGGCLGALVFSSCVELVEDGYHRRVLNKSTVAGRQ